VVIAIDFDGTLVEDDRPYEDTFTPLVLKPNARTALAMMKAAGHTLILYSARANRAMLFNPELNPLVRNGYQGDPSGSPFWAWSQEVHWARWFQMIDFLATELPGVFDAIDDGAQGKPQADLFIDDKAVRFGQGIGAFNWEQLARLFGVAYSPATSVR
jgi:hypothetical protein